MALDERFRADPRGEFEHRFEWCGWWVILRFGLLAGRVECTGMEVLGDPDGNDHAPLTSSALRKLPFGTFVDDARRGYREGVHRGASMDPDAAGWAPGLSRKDREALASASRADARERLGRLELDDERRRFGRPRAYGAEHYAKVAEIYTAAWRQGGNPTMEVAERFQTSRSAAAKWVARARHKGLLPLTTKGRPTA
jgi:hypothetical protein